MKHLYIIAALMLLWWLPQTTQAQQYTGISGLVHVPTGETNHEGDAFIGAHFLNKNMMPDTGFLYQGEKYHTFDYYVALTPFSWLEMSYICTERIYRKDDQGNIVNWSKDRYASVKIALPAFFVSVYHGRVRGSRRPVPSPVFSDAK